jgi:membrane associated rhomboid family serine protease
MSSFSIVYLIIGFTSLISILAFNNPDLMYRLRHWPFQEKRQKEYYRWLTSGFLHGDYMHLFFNMFTLYGFGEAVEYFFEEYFGQFGIFLFVIFYLLAIIASSSATYQKYKDVPSFASIGASGAVSAVLFAAILFMPTVTMRLLILPIPIPAFVFGILYLWYSDYAAKRGGDGIDHMAHFFGAVFGFFFPILLKPETFPLFLSQISEWLGSF